MKAVVTDAPIDCKITLRNMACMEFFTIIESKDKSLIGKVGFIESVDSHHYKLFIIGASDWRTLTSVLLLFDAMDKIIVRPYKADESFSVSFEE